MGFFYIFSILSDNKAYTLTEILEQIPNVNEKNDFSKENLRIKLEELEEAGYLKMDRSEKAVKYFLADDIWSEFSNQELEDICLLLEFVRNIVPFEIPFYYLQRKEKDMFLFKNQHLFKVSNTIRELRNEFIKQGMQPFNALNFHLDNNFKFNIEYQYEINTAIGGVEREIIWAYEKIEIKPDSKYGLQILNEYLNMKTEK